MNYITSFGFSIRWRKQFLKKIGHSEEKLEVLDLLSGLGENWRVLKKNFPNSNISALDFSQEMINQSAHKNQKQFGGSIKLLQEDMLNNKLPDNFYDKISCAFGLKTFNEAQLEILARELHRILKPGAEFSFVEVSKPRNRILYPFYSFYLSRVIPVLGYFFLGNPRDYKMLWIYTKSFGNSKKTAEIFSKAGLETSYNDYFFGCASGISGRKSLG
jgi:demethylmenaquinone methyltransferase/2-methoxy-6-polyprenyl-1,4-benzoquinol methylase